MKRTLLFFVMLSGILVPASAAGDGGVFGLVRKLGTFIDSMSVSGVDRRYIDAPEKPWQIILRGNTNQTDLKMKSMMHVTGVLPGVSGMLNWEPRIKTVPATYVGLWAGYRGYGLGYSVNVSGGDGSYLTFGAMGGSFGLNFRLHRFETDEASILFTGNVGDTQFYEKEVGKLDDPINVRTLFIDGYYLFNGRHCSYAAAYDQSVIQKRSAGSVIAGAMYYYSHFDFSQARNADFIEMMNGIGNIRQWQVGVGAGYIYNLVPCRGLLVSAQLMPIIAFFDRVKVTRYKSNNDDYSDEYLDIGRRYEAGKITEEERDRQINALIDHYRIWEVGEEKDNGKVKLNFDARLSITYQWDRFFINAYGQFCNFPYSYDDGSGRLNDWYINAAIGVRL